MRTDRQRVLASTVAVGLIAAFVIGLWLPHRSQASSMRHEIDQQRLGLRALLDTEVTDAPDPTARLRSADADLDVAVPAKLDMGPLLTGLNAQIAAESIEVEQLEADAVVEGGDFNRIPIRLQCRATYQALVNLLVRIESSPRIMRVDRIDVFKSFDEEDDESENEGGDEHHGLLSVEISISAFSQAGAENSS